MASTEDGFTFPMPDCERIYPSPTAQSGFQAQAIQSSTYAYDPQRSNFVRPNTSHGCCNVLSMRNICAQRGTGLAAAAANTEAPASISGEPIYGSPQHDQGDEVRFSVELTRLDRLDDTYSLDVRRLKGNLRSYKFLYDTLRERADLQR
ncbi:hypothetical protein NM688_g592 [Phlebia brevispora]|uniref:Uncharacterized protein n=1 Tax=Phlebia brevispora TaxID=194682 RepID=A0ACC1TDX4_9APHY|nr:hypothetical protein NM688_g592 [Phlebia brevispora]